MTVRVGFLGAGLIATYHSKSLRRSGADAAWTGVYDPDRERADRFAAASGAPVRASEHEVLDNCDAVYVMTWTAEHERLVAAAADRGLAVFCEKPLATDAAGAGRMTEAVTAAGVVHQVGLVLRHSPVFALARDLVAEEESGRVMSVVFRDDQFIPIQGHYGSTWRGDVAKAGAGTLLEHSIHDLDVLDWVIGPLESVSARSVEFHGIAGIEDSVAATVAFTAGGVGVLTSVWHDILERPSLRRLEIFSERLYVGVEGDWFGPIRWQQTGTNEESLEGEALVAECERRGLTLGNPDGLFVAAVADGRPAWPGFDVALRAHLAADAVYRSAAAGGEPVAIPRSGAEM